MKTIRLEHPSPIDDNISETSMTLIYLVVFSNLAILTHLGRTTALPQESTPNLLMADILNVVIA